MFERRRLLAKVDRLYISQRLPNFIRNRPARNSDRCTLLPRRETDSPSDLLKCHGLRSINHLKSQQFRSILLSIVPQKAALPLFSDAVTGLQVDGKVNGLRKKRELLMHAPPVVQFTQGRSRFTPRRVYRCLFPRLVGSSTIVV